MHCVREFAWLLASKMGRNRHSRTNARITGNLPGYWLQKSAEITVLRLIRVSQENWKLFFVILIKYFIILSNLEAFSR